jgi:PadR family transcriptional regulator, regulatory protein AphA
VTKKSAYTGPLSPEYALLGFLEQGPSYGYELYQKMVTDLGQVWHTSLSQAYNILNRLESQGFIAAQVLEQEKLPARRLFSLTSKGMERFDGWLKATSFTSVRAIRLEFLTRLFFARQREAAFAHHLIDAQLAEVQTGLERLARQYLEIPPEQLINRLSVELRLRQLESTEKWLESCHPAVEMHPSMDDG